jgi:hypothetical protein
MNIRNLVLLALISLVSATVTYAAPRDKGRSDKVSTSSSAPGYSQPMNIRWGAGFASVPSLTASSSSLSAWIGLNDDNAIQALFSIPTTSPEFRISFAGLYKHVVVPGQNAGIHIGGGFGLGNIPSARGGTDFFMSLGMVAGIRYLLPGATNVMLNLDGGPSIAFGDSTSDFSLGAFSEHLGLGITYLF